MPARRRFPVPVLIVQRGGVFVERDDGVVRQLIVGLATGGAERGVNFKFAGAGTERALGGTVAPGAEYVGLAQTFELVLGFGGAR